MDIEELKKHIIAKISASRGELANLSRELHDNPETAFEEHRASARLTGFLEKHGFAVEKGICDLPTAFRASHGNGAPVIAFSPNTTPSRR